MLLTELLPPLVHKMEQLLQNDGELDLAAHVPRLTIVERCR